VAWSVKGRMKKGDALDIKIEGHDGNLRLLCDYPIVDTGTITQRG